MRTYGRIYDENGNYKWVEVSTADNGSNDYVWITTLIQTLKLNLNESPFFANYGIPAQRTIIQQIYPDFYVQQTQQQFAQYFSSLSISRIDTFEPTYSIGLVLNDGTKMNLQVAV